MVSMAETTRSKLEQNLNTINLPLLFRDLAQALQEKHIMITLKNPDLAKFLRSHNWDGALQSDSGDYLMVADANVGFNKASALVEKHLNYRLVLAEDGNGQAHVNLIYRHLAPQQPQETCRHEIRYDPVYEQNMVRCYWNYLHLVVPAEAQLMSWPQIIVPGKHLLRGQPTTGALDHLALNTTRMNWGQLLLLPPGETVSLDYHYTLPAGTAQYIDDHWEYTLYLQKQAGTQAPSAEIFVTLPTGAQILEIQPLPSNNSGSQISYRLNLRTDEIIHISYTLP
jgi:hypothetical protein